MPHSSTSHNDSSVDSIANDTCVFLADLGFNEREYALRQMFIEPDSEEYPEYEAMCVELDNVVHN